MARLDWYIRANLKPRHLQLLVALDDLRNIARVAQSVNVTQPAVSKALVDIERGLGVPLFDRSNRGVRPTAFGSCMIRHARTMLADLEVARSELSALISGEAGTVSVGVLPAASPVLLPRSVAELKRRSPTTTVVIKDGTAGGLLSDLRGGTLDVVVGTLPAARVLSGIDTRVLLSEQPIVLVCGTQHPLARRRKIFWRDLASFPWILPPIGTAMREPLEQTFAEHDLRLPVNRVESVSMTANKTILQETQAISFFSKNIAEYYHELGIITVLPLEIRRLVGPVGIMWLADTPLSPSSELLIECLGETALRISRG